NCAKRYKTGLFDRTAIIMEYGSQTPLGALDKEAISQITWALKDANGHTARQFATLKPTPPIDWLEILTAQNLLTLSTPLHSPIAAVTWLPTSRAAPALHPVTRGLTKWLVTMLATPELVTW